MTGAMRKRIALKPTGDGVGSIPLDSDASAPMTPGLEAEAERLLSRRTRDIRFSPEMFQAYRRKTWSQRSKIARAWMIWVTAISYVFVPISYLLVPDCLQYSAAIGFLVIPGLNAGGYLVWRKPRSSFVEGLSVFVIMSVMLVAFGLLGMAAGGSADERLLTGMLYVTTISIVVFSIDYAWSLAVMVGCTLIFCGFELLNSAVDFRTAIGISLLYAMGIYTATIARKTQSILSQKSFLMSLRDQYQRAQLEILATRDPLTGLANRRSAASLIDRLWNDRRIAKPSIAFVMADIDSFKRLNDSAGHAAGDECIRRVARTIEQSMRLGDDAVCRYGGEEFLIVLTNTTPDLAWALAERIRRAVEALGIVNPGVHRADGSSAVVTISLGVAFARDGVAPELVAKWADDALYDAKRSGRNVVFMATDEAADGGPSAGSTEGSPPEPGHAPTKVA
jgi:diguanylate cyclase (GGDEF)-like protein